MTRDEPPEGPLSAQLRALGLRVLLWPVVRIAAPADAAPLEQALARIAAYDWIVFTSRHAVAAVTERLPAAPPGVAVAAVGEQTAAALRERGWRVDCVPAQESAAGLVAVLSTTLGPGQRVLFPASSRALPTLMQGLSRLGAVVDQVQAYRTEAAPLDVEECRGRVAREEIGAVTFTSPSAVQELQRALGTPHWDRLLTGAAAVALGPTTARALIALGHTPVTAQPQTLAGLAATTLTTLQTRSPI